VARHPKGGAQSKPTAVGQHRVRRMIWPAVAFPVPLGVLIVLKGPQIGAALAACPPMALIAAVGAHVGSLICRCEAWRLAVHATDCTPIPRTSTHAAGGVGFAAGSLQGASTAPVRAVALRKIARRFAPPIEHSLVAEAPILFIDAGLTALVLTFAVATAAVAPAWAPALAVAVSIASIAGLWVAGRRYGHKRAGAGLRVLSDARRRLPLTALVAGTVVFGLLRAWIMLSAFGLPDGPASVAILFVVVGVFGSFPIGPSSTPAATVALFGATDATAAVAAGIALSATSILAVAVYAVGAIAAFGLSTLGTRSIRRVDQPKPRAASPSPVSGL
jgi:hypothetical protein